MGSTNDGNASASGFPEFVLFAPGSALLPVPAAAAIARARRAAERGAEEKGEAGAPRTRRALSAQLLAQRCSNQSVGYAMEAVQHGIAQRLFTCMHASPKGGPSKIQMGPRIHGKSKDN